MKCVRCNRETSGDLTVAGQVVGPMCFRKMFPELVKTRKTKVVHQEQLGLLLMFEGEESGENEGQQGENMTTQIEAERLADELVSMWDKGYLEREDVEQAAAELRRLHEANEKLVDMFHELSEVQRKTELERYRLHEVNKDLLDVLAIVADAENYDFTLADCKEISRAAISRAQP